MADAPMDEDELATDPGDQVTGNAPTQGVAAPAAPQQPPPAVGIGAMQARAQQRDAQIAALQPEIARRYGAIQQGYQGESENASALKQLLIDTRQRLSTAYAPPSTGERVSNILGAFATARPGGGFGNAAGAGALAGAQQQAQMRKDAVSKEELMAKYGIEANQADQMAKQYSVQAAQAGMQPLMTQYNSAESAADRLAQQTAAEANKERNAPVNVNVNGQPQVNSTLIDAKAQLAKAQQVAKNAANSSALTPEVIDAEATIARSNGGKLDYAFVRSNPLAGPAVVQRMADQERELGNQNQSIVYEGMAKHAQQNAAANWDSPAASSGGTVVRRLGVAISHMQVLGRYLQALDNGDSTTANKMKLGIQKEFNLSTVPSTVEALAPILSNEVVNSINARGGTGAERDEGTHALGEAKAYSTQKAILEGETRLLAGQLGGLKTQYDASNMSNVLGPFRTRVDAKILRDPILAASIGEAPETGPVHVMTPEEAALYPSGTPIIRPDGQTAWVK